MTTEKSKTSEATGGEEPEEITFRCQNCNQDRPVEDMRVITRFFPPLVVCRDCEKNIG